MDDIRVHYNSPQPARLQAFAFTQGVDIHLAPGQEHQLGHEAWHAVQQKQGRVQPSFRHAGVAINDSPALEAEADRLGAQLRGVPAEPSPAAAAAPAAAPSAAPVAQRAVTIAGALLGRPTDLPHFGLLSLPPQQALGAMVDDRANIYAFASVPAVLAYLANNDAGSAPTVTAIPDATVKAARAAKNRAHFDRLTVPEPNLAQNPAFHNIPKEQLYLLPEGHYWVRNPISSQHERRRKRSQPATTGEELLEYVDPSDTTRENYGYLRNGQMITSRADPSSTAGLSRSGAGSKALYKDKRGGMINMRVFKGKNAGKAIQPFKRQRDNKTFTIGHSVAVKNMSLATDPGGLNSDEQPKMMVPENRTVGEQMKNPALEPEDRPYVWYNFYSPTPETTYSGHPIPSATQATVFKSTGDVDFSVKLVNDGSVDYRTERENKRAGRKEYSYKQFMIENAKVPAIKPPIVDVDQDLPMTPSADPPRTPEYFPGVFEEQTISSTAELTTGETHSQGGQDWQIGWFTGKSTTGEFGYKIGRTNFYVASDTDKAAASKLLAPPATTTTSTAADPTVDATPSSGKPVLTQGDADPSSLLLDDVDFDADLNDPQLAELFARIAADLQRQAAELRQGVVGTATRIRSAVPKAWETTVGGELAAISKMLEEVAAVDLGDVGASRQFETNFGQLNGLFRRIEPILTRTVTGSGGDVTAAQGYRLPAIAQFFAECGQMAAHNVLALSNPANLASYDVLQAALQDTGALRALGTFDNQINDNDIRGLLAQAGGHDIPVIGRIGDTEGLLAATDHDLVAVWNLDVRQLQELGTLRRFINGETNGINLVINTRAAADSGGGYHWITVRVERHGDAVRLFYADSLDAAVDYSALFTRLKQMLGFPAV